MIISRTPLRISFVGGGTDLPAFYEREPGAVLGTTINKYIYITVNPKFDHKIRASYSRTEIVDDLESLQHELIRESLKMVGIRGSIEITSISDIPSQGTGLGSSSTYTVGLLNALYAYLGRRAGAERLAREAYLIERERCGRHGGKQDQYFAAYGGWTFFRFDPDGSVFVEPVICPPETRRAVQRHFLLLYTGLTRRADDILAEQERNSYDEATRAVLRRMAQLAEEMREALSRNSIESFGEILHANWMEKRKLARGISNAQIDRWYAIARQHGAIGGKLLGAGGGGFLLLYAPPERHQEIVQALPELRSVPFRFEPHGSRIIYIEESGYGC